MNMNTQLQEIIERGRQAAEERKRREEMASIARREREAARYRDRLLRSGLPGWMIEHLSVELHDSDAWYTLALPGCTPVAFTVVTYTDGTRYYDKIAVRRGEGVCYDQDAGLWRIRYSYDHIPRGADSLDEAIALAADYGESWHALAADVERRNAEGLRPTPAEPTPQPEQEDGAITDAVELLNKFAADAGHGQSTVVLASAVLAVAVELRRIHNALVGGAAGGM